MGLAVLVAVGGCTNTPIAGGHEPYVRLSVVQREHELVVSWVVENPCQGPIWIVDKLTMGDDAAQMPRPFIVPPADLMLLSGMFHWSQARYGPAGPIVEVGPEIRPEYREVPSKGHVAGSLRIVLPYAGKSMSWGTLPNSDQTNADVCLANPYKFPRRGSSDTPIIIHSIDAIQVAVEYWTERPAAEGASGRTTLYDDDVVPLARTLVARSLLEGKPMLPLEGRNVLSRGIALSERVFVSLQMDDAAGLFFESKKTDLFRGTEGGLF